MAAQRLRARWVLPVDAEPIEDGEIIVEEDRIVEVRPVRQIGQVGPHDRRDFGDAVLMPGLVNAHTHIDYTVMRGLLEDIPFFDWIRDLTLRKAALEEPDWIASATMGAAEALAGGVTTIADCTDSGAALLGAKKIGLRGIIYQEVFALDESVSVEETLKELKLKVNAMQWAATGTKLRIGVSPHAPYTVRPEALRSVASYARFHDLPTCIHAAESQAEVEWIRHGGGCIGERDACRGIGWMQPAPACTALELLSACEALGPQTLLVHGVQIAAADRAIIRDSGVAWAHCPKSNAKLGNGIAPLGLLRECYPAGEARIGLGSDSVASNNTMDLFEEMRFAVLAQRARGRKITAMSARQAVEMATIGGARALGMSEKIGTLTPGKQADVIAVRLDGIAALPAHDPYSALVYSADARDVEMAMIAGQPLYDRGGFTAVDLAPHRDRLLAAASKIRSWSPPA